MAQYAQHDHLVICVAIALIGVDLLLIGINLFVVATGLSPKLQAAINIDAGILRDPFFSVNEDGGLPEILGYAKMMVIAALMSLCAQRFGQPIHLAVATAFLIILLDDALMVHETAGAYIATLLDFQPRFGLRAVDFGEMSVFALWLLALIALAVVGVRRSGRAHRDASLLFVGIIAVMAFFTLIVDAAVVILYEPFRRVAKMLGVIEDGGEMVAISVATLIALLIVRHPALVGATHGRRLPAGST